MAWNIFGKLLCLEEIPSYDVQCAYTKFQHWRIKCEDGLLIQRNYRSQEHPMQPRNLFPMSDKILLKHKIEGKN